MKPDDRGWSIIKANREHTPVKLITNEYMRNQSLLKMSLHLEPGVIANRAVNILT